MTAIFKLLMKLSLNLNMFYESYPDWSGENQNYPGFNLIISDEVPCKKMSVNKVILHHKSKPQPAYEAESYCHEM